MRHDLVRAAIIVSTSPNLEELEALDRPRTVVGRCEPKELSNQSRPAETQDRNRD